MNKRTLFKDFVQLSVRLNGLVVPGRLIERTLAAYSFNLVVYNNHETYKVSLVGSATAVHFNGRYILLCSNHQLRGVDPQQVAMLKDDGSFLVTSGGYRTYQVRSDTDANDIAAFDFTEPVAAHPDLKRRFFDLTDLPPDTPVTNVMAMLLTGYPSVGQTYDLETKNHLGLARLNVVCEPDGQPNDNALMRVRATSPLSIDPDGMSGGSAFVIQMAGTDLRAYFAGIILQGSRKLFHVLKPGYVVAFLRSVYP
ncbi:MAG: hypothetical protein E5V78_10460 [Mesorhizobium sp.]|nr:MAG: hypothetical protein EOS60_31265 [Mesorhizobium sp.]TIV87317.1 MAG: hypothetical protein E5V78_10460 [Mesorhizobium sp.]